MIYLFATTDIIRTTVSSAAAVDVNLNYLEAVTSTGALAGAGRAFKAFSSASSDDTLAGPGGSNYRSLKQGTWRNKDAALAVDVTVMYRASGPVDYELHKVTLQPGESLIYIEGIGFFTNARSSGKSGLKNCSTADQSIGASTTAYLTGSAILLPKPPVAGTVLRFMYQIAKTAAATATQTVDLRFGIGGSTSDASRNAFTLDTETAVADEMLVEVLATIRGPIGASCIVEAVLMAADNLTTTGFSNTARKAQIRRTQSAAFDITTAGLIAGLSITSGASHALTVRQVIAEMLVVGG